MSAPTKAQFISLCKRYNVEFIEPGPVVSEGALEVLDMAIAYLDLNEEIGSGLREIKAALTPKKEKGSEDK